MNIIRVKLENNKRVRELVECSDYKDLEHILIQKHDRDGMCFLPFKSYEHVSEFFDEVLDLEEITETKFYLSFLKYKKQRGFKSRSHRSRDYYTLRGYSIDEATRIISELQVEASNTNKQSRINNAVKAKRERGLYSAKQQSRGRAFYRDKGLSEAEVESKIAHRNAKWFASMQQAIERDPTIITRRLTTNGTNRHQNTSSIEDYVHNHLDCNWNAQYVITGGSRNFVYDFVNHENRLLIEVNGDFWHANPEIYDKDWVNPITKLTAKEKWNLDKEKIQYAESKGFRVITIWEKNIKELSYNKREERQYYYDINNYNI